MIKTPLTLNKPIYLTDRTTIETDWECGMKRWWYKHQDGGGIVPVKEPTYYREGRLIHADLAKIAEGHSLEQVLGDIETPDPLDIMAVEVWSRRIGWITAWATWIWPSLRLNYEVMFAERELILEYGPLWVANTADLVVRDNRDGRVVVFDFKSVGMLTRNWVNHWPYAVQMHINTKAVEVEIKEAPKFAQVIGLVKGHEEGGKLRHPYVWAYSDGQAGWSKGWKKDWLLRPTVEYPGGPHAWALKLGQEEAQEQFVFSAPIIPDERLLESLLADRTQREADIAFYFDGDHASGNRHRATFEPRFSKCRPSIGSECAYLGACHNAEINADPLGSGLYVKRTPHHEVELIGVPGDEVSI